MREDEMIVLEDADKAYDRLRTMLSDELEEELVNGIINQAKDEFPRWPDKDVEAFLNRLTAIERKKYSQSSSASLSMRDRKDSVTLDFSHIAGPIAVSHEFAHGLMDTWGYDTTQLCTDRASSYDAGHFPRFGWGSTDAPCWNYMLRDYENMGEYTRHEVTDVDELEPNDLVIIDDGSGHAKGRVRPHLEEDNKKWTERCMECSQPRGCVKIIEFPGSVVTLKWSPCSNKDLYRVDREEVTPGLREIRLDRKISYSDPIKQLVARINVNWWTAAEYVKKRTQPKRDFGVSTAIKKGYSVNNAHETWTAFHELMQADRPVTLNRYVPSLVRYNHDIIEAYTEIFELSDNARAEVNKHWDLRGDVRQSF